MAKYFIYSKTEFTIILLWLKLLKNHPKWSLGHEKLSNMTILSSEIKINEEMDTENTMELLLPIKPGAHVSLWSQAPA